MFNTFIKKTRLFINKELQYHIKYLLIILILLYLLYLLSLKLNKNKESFRIELQFSEEPLEQASNALVELKPEFNTSGASTSHINVKIYNNDFFYVRSSRKINNPMNIIGIEKYTQGSILLHYYKLKDVNNYRTLNDIPNFTITDKGIDTGTDDDDYEIRINWDSEIIKNANKSYNDLYKKILMKNIFIFNNKYKTYENMPPLTNIYFTITDIDTKTDTKTDTDITSNIQWHQSEEQIKKFVIDLVVHLGRLLNPNFGDAPKKMYAKTFYSYDDQEIDLTHFHPIYDTNVDTEQIDSDNSITIQYKNQ